MKSVKFLPIVSFCLIAVMFLSSCSITKNNDFASQKYTNFKKGKSKVIINKVEKKSIEANLLLASTNQKIEKETVTSSSAISQTIITSKPDIKKTSDKKENLFNAIAKETKKEKLSKTLSFVKNNLKDKPNTTAANDRGLSVLWVVVLVLLILWAVGSWGFNLGGLINILLVIALILLILWLLQVI